MNVNQNSIQGVRGVQSGDEEASDNQEYITNLAKQLSYDKSNLQIPNSAALIKAKRCLIRKRNRIGKTPAEKINWTPEEVSI